MLNSVAPLGFGVWMTREYCWELRDSRVMQFICSRTRDLWLWDTRTAMSNTQSCAFALKTDFCTILNIFERKQKDQSQHCLISVQTDKVTGTNSCLWYFSRACVLLGCVKVLEEKLLFMKSFRAVCLLQLFHELFTSSAELTSIKHSFQE